MYVFVVEEVGMIFSLLDVVCMLSVYLGKLYICVAFHSPVSNANKSRKMIAINMTVYNKARMLS